MLLLHLLLPFSIPTVFSQQFGITTSTPSNESKECMELVWHFGILMAYNVHRYLRQITGIAQSSRNVV
jgi:hypothetical protein